MLINFNIDIDALIADIEANPGFADIWLMELWDFWQAHGIFCGGKTDNVSDQAERLLDSTLAHKAPVSTIIQALIDNDVELNRRIKEDVDVSFRNVNNCSDLSEFRTHSVLTLMGGAQVTAMKEDKEKFCIHCSDVEVVPWQYARNACLLEEFPRNFIIPEDWNGRQIWNARFQKYIPYVDDIAVIDTNALQERNMWALSHFIKWTSDAAERKLSPHVKIYCTLENITSRTPARLKSLFEHYDISKRKLGKLTVCLFDKGAKPDFPKDRWARLGESNTLTFHGLRILQDKISAGERCDLLESHAADELRVKEEALDKNKNKMTINID